MAFMAFMDKWTNGHFYIFTPMNILKCLIRPSIFIDSDTNGELLSKNTVKCPMHFSMDNTIFNVRHIDIYGCSC